MNIQKTTNRLLVSLSLLAAFMATSFSPIFAESGNSVSSKQCKLNKICKIVKEDLAIDKQILDIVSCGACIRITPEDFMDADGNLSQSYVITTPGVYCLCSSIDFTPAFDGQDAIQILSNDVTLDLGGNILRQANDAQDVTGVRIGQDFSETAVFNNITVRNGDIFNFTGQGVGVLNVAISVTGDAFENLTFSDLTVSECGSNGSFNFASGINLASFAFLVSETLVAYKDVTIERCKVNNCLGSGAIQVYTCDGLVIQDTQANNTSATSSPFDAVVGVQVLGRNLQLTNVQANGTHGVDINFGLVAGIVTRRSENISMLGCSANNTLSEGMNNSTAGVFIDSCNNLTISGCQFNNTVGLNSNVVGNFIENSNNVFVQDTLFNNTLNLAPVAPSSNNQTAGLFSDRGNGHYFLNCQFNNTFSETSNIVQGVNCSYSDNTLYENCQFNNTAGGASASLIAGIHMSDTRNQQDQGNGMKWLNCQFNGANVSDENRGAAIIGFIAITLKNIIFEGCQATNIISNNPNSFAYGFIIGTQGLEPAPGFANVHNVTFSHCTVSDIRSGNETIGINGPVDQSNEVSGIQGLQTNFVIQNCIAERISSPSATARVAGIAERLFVSFGIDYQFPRMINLSVTDCRVSDVRAGEGNPFSAGILVESVENPVLSGNSVSDCDRGILFTGNNTITPNGFQLATSVENALTFPPVFINLETITTTTTPPPSYSPAPAGTFRLHISTEILPLELRNNNLNLFYFSGAGASIPFPTPFVSPGGSVNNLGAPDGLAFLGVQDSGFDDYGPFWTFDVNFLVNYNSEAAFGYVFINATTYTNDNIALIITIPIADVLRANNGGDVFRGYAFSAPQTFTNTNLAQGNQVEVSPTQVRPVQDFILPAEDLTALDWQTGDPILYTNNGNGNIPELVSGTTYFAIVYRPGFTERGLVQTNKVTNCSVAGYQDDRTPTTSGWVDNTALINGPTPAHAENYAINWGIPAPVDEGSLTTGYPATEHKYYNLSLLP